MISPTEKVLPIDCNNGELQVKQNYCHLWNPWLITFPSFLHHVIERVTKNNQIWVSMTNYSCKHCYFSPHVIFAVSHTQTISPCLDMS